MMAQPVPNPFHFASPTPLTLPSQSFSPTFSSARKRRALTPPPQGTSPANPWAFESPAVTHDSPQPKRRRPNLANGFSGLSISPQLANAPPRDLTEDDDETSPIAPTAPVIYDDVDVQVLPDHVAHTRPNHHHHSTLHHWSMPNHASSSSPSPTSEHSSDYNSDETFRPQLFTRPQQADEVLSPESAAKQFPLDSTVQVEDITSPTRTRKRREKAQGSSHNTKRRKNDMDMDTDMDMEPQMDMDSDDRQRRRRTVWHEPEKDRIVITALSDSGSSRSASPESGYDEDDRRLTQPGDQGFTISPSLLTHLLKAQRNNLESLDHRKGTENELVLYRPLGLHPGQYEEIVKAWTGEERYEDSGRFEEIDEDETTGRDVTEQNMTWADDDVDMSMDVE